MGGFSFLTSDDGTEDVDEVSNGFTTGGSVTALCKRVGGSVGALSTRGGPSATACATGTEGGLVIALVTGAVGDSGFKAFVSLWGFAL